jgi:hypothetical protein
MAGTVTTQNAPPKLQGKIIEGKTVKTANQELMILPFQN